MRRPTDFEGDDLLPGFEKQPINDVPDNKDDPSTYDVKRVPGVEVLETMPILDDPPRTNEATTREVPVTNPVLDDPPHDDSDDADDQIAFFNH